MEIFNWFTEGNAQRATVTHVGGIIRYVTVVISDGTWIYVTSEGSGYSRIHNIKADSLISIEYERGA